MTQKKDAWWKPVALLMLVIAFGMDLLVWQLSGGVEALYHRTGSDSRIHLGLRRHQHCLAHNQPRFLASSFSMERANHWLAIALCNCIVLGPL